MLLWGTGGHLRHRLGGGKTDPGKKGNGGWGWARAGEEKPVVGKYKINSGPRGHSRGNTGWSLGWGRRPRWGADVVAHGGGGRPRNPGPAVKHPLPQGVRLWPWCRSDTRSHRRGFVAPTTHLSPARQQVLCQFHRFPWHLPCGLLSTCCGPGHRLCVEDPAVTRMDRHPHPQAVVETEVINIEMIYAKHIYMVGKVSLQL